MVFQFTEASVMGLRVMFLWIPAHVGIKGNELADSFMQKKPQKKSRTDTTVNFSTTEMSSVD